MDCYEIADLYPLALGLLPAKRNLERRCDSG